MIRCLDSDAMHLRQRLQVLKFNDSQYHLPSFNGMPWEEKIPYQK